MCLYNKLLILCNKYQVNLGENDIKIIILTYYNNRVNKVVNQFPIYINKPEYRKKKSKALNKYKVFLLHCSISNIHLYLVYMSFLGEVVTCAQTFIYLSFSIMHLLLIAFSIGIIKIYIYIFNLE